MADIGVFSNQTAKEMLQAFRQLKSAGLLEPGVIQSLVRGSPAFTEAPKKFTNISGEIIPPYACMQIVDTEVIGGQVFLQADRPADATSDAGPYIFNWHRSVEPMRQGVAQKHRILRAYSNGDPVTPGDRWAPVVDSWQIERNDSGPFQVCGEDQPATDVHGFPVVKIALGAAGGGSNKIQFTVDSAAIAGSSSPYHGKMLLQVTVEVEPCDQDIATAEVVDWSPCLANAEAPEDLVGRFGWAHRARGRQSLASGAADGEKTPCHWALDGLCCP